MSDGGFFLMHRGWRDNPLFKGEFSRAEAWVWLIENACWKPTRFDVKGKMVTLERGQLCASRERLATAWGWSPSAVERFLARLQTEQMIGRETGQGKSVLTICNYARYQDRGAQTGQETERPTGQEPDRDRTAKEQGNKGTIEVEEAKASPTKRARRAPAADAERTYRMPADWVPGPLPPDVAELVAQWPPGRVEREAAGTRDYWLTQTTKRPGWDLTFHNRIRQIHDQVLRDNRNGRTRPDQQHPVAPSGRSMGRTEAAGRAALAAIAERDASASQATGSGGGDSRIVALPHPVRAERMDDGRPYRVAGDRA